MDDDLKKAGTHIELLLKNEVYQIVNCAMEVLNAIGHGLVEKIYENSLIVELKHRGIPFDQQKRFVISYKRVRVGEFIPDLITHESIVAETQSFEWV